MTPQKIFRCFVTMDKMNKCYNINVFIWMMKKTWCGKSLTQSCMSPLIIVISSDMMISLGVLNIMHDVTCDHALFKRFFTKHATSLIVDNSFPPSNMKDPVLNIKIVG